jgi:hypothetical protein
MALFDSNPLSAITNQVTSGVSGLFDGFNGMNAFGSSIPSGILDTTQEDKLRKQALLQGLLGTAATYLATPKNLNTGSALPYLGKAFLGGMNASQDVIDRALNNAYRQKLLAGKEDNIRTIKQDRFEITQERQPDGSYKEIGRSALDAPVTEKLPVTRTIKRGRQEVFQELQSDGTYKDYSTSSLDAPQKPQETKYTIQNDASGQAIYVPDKPGAQALDMQGRPTTYKPALSPDQAKRQEKLEKQQDIPNLIKEAKLLLPKATGSGLGAARDIAAATFGQSTEGAQNLASLKAIQAALILKMPRLEGPQGVLDLKLYEAAAGDIGNPFVPAATKLKALETLEKFQDKYKNEITLNQPDAQTQQTNAPQSGGFKEGAKTKSKSGKSMIFRNGQWEYE